MEFPTSQIPRTDSLHGTPKPSLSTSDLSHHQPQNQQQQQQPLLSDSMTTISPNSLIGFRDGVQSKTPDPESQEPVIPMPPAEEIAAAKPTEKRILKVTREQLWQWQQILGGLKKRVNDAFDT
jgi:hypothetical protein